jgi:hypothetical protein
LSVAEDRQVELAKALGVGEYLDFDDLPARDREAKDDSRPSTRSPHGSHGSVHQRHSCGPGTGHKNGMTGPLGYWEVSDIRSSLQALLDAGAETQQEVKDVVGGKLIASVKDPDGNVIGLTQSP